MATLSIQPTVKAGLTPTLGAATGGGDAIPYDPSERTFLLVNNASGGSITVTATAQITSRNVPGAGAVTVANMAIAVAAGALKIIGPFPSDYADANGLVQITYSGVTSLTVGAVRVTS